MKNYVRGKLKKKTIFGLSLFVIYYNKISSEFLNKQEKTNKKITPGSKIASSKSYILLWVVLFKILKSNLSYSQELQ